MAERIVDGDLKVHDYVFTKRELLDALKESGPLRELVKRKLLEDRSLADAWAADYPDLNPVSRELMMIDDMIGSVVHALIPAGRTGLRITQKPPTRGPDKPPDGTYWQGEVKE